MNQTVSRLGSLPHITTLNGLFKLGTCEVDDKLTNDKVKVELYFDPTGFPKTHVFAILTEANQHYVLGRIIYVAVSKIGGHSKYKVDQIDISEKQKKFYLENKESFKPILFVDDLWSPGRQVFKNIGKNLIDYAKKESIKGECQGRLMLDAVNCSHGFYYKQNLRTMVKVAKGSATLWSAREVDKLIEKTSPDTNYLGQVLMYLPQQE